MTPPAAEHARSAGHGSARRGWILAAAGLIAAFLAFGLIADAFAPAPQGPAQSSYATSPEGVAAWAELLARDGHLVTQLRSSPASTRLPSAATVVLLGAASLTDDEARQLARFVRAGGTLVIGGGEIERALAALVANPPRWAPAGPRFARAVGKLPEVRGVGEVRSAGEGAWSAGGGEIAVGSGPRDALLLVRPLGRGRIDAIADPSPLENRLLSAADNARLALDLGGARGSPVIFTEAQHGFGTATGLAAIPGRWWLTLTGLALALGAWALSRGRRLGPAEPGEAPQIPPRSVFVDGMARLLLRAADAGGLEHMATASALRQRERDRRLGLRGGK